MTTYRKKNILLINPWIYDFAAYDLWIKPLGLLYLGGLLRENGYHVHLIDCLNACHPQLKSCTGIKLPKRHVAGHGELPKERVPKPRSLKNIKRNYNRYGITPDILVS